MQGQLFAEAEPFVSLRLCYLLLMQFSFYVNSTSTGTERKKEMEHTSKDLLHLEHKNSSTSSIGTYILFSFVLSIYVSAESSLLPCLCLSMQNLHFLFVTKKICHHSQRNQTLIKTPSAIQLPEAKVH